MVVYQGPAPLMGPTALLEFKSAAAVEHKRLFYIWKHYVQKAKSHGARPGCGRCG